MTATAHSITITQMMNATAAQLYAAWTDPAIMCHWFATVVEADVRIGGRYRLEVHETDGSINAFTGEYLVLEPARRVKQTFSHSGAPEGLYSGEYVEVTFRELASSQTELTLVNGWNGAAASGEELEAVKTGWGEWLELLQAQL